MVSSSSILLLLLLLLITMITRVLLVVVVIRFLFTTLLRRYLREARSGWSVTQGFGGLLSAAIIAAAHGGDNSTGQKKKWMNTMDERKAKTISPAGMIQLDLHVVALDCLSRYHIAVW